MRLPIHGSRTSATVRKRILYERISGTIEKKMKEFIEGIRLPDDPKSHVGFPEDKFESRLLTIKESICLNQ